MQKQEVEEYAEHTCHAFKSKADHNKTEAMACFICIVFCTLAAPLFVTLGTGLLIAKVIPSILSLAAAGLTSWLQLRKPQQLWSLYRTCQRRIEDAQAGYYYDIGDFEKSTERKKLRLIRETGGRKRDGVASAA